MRFRTFSVRKYARRARTHRGGTVSRARACFGNGTMSLGKARMPLGRRTLPFGKGTLPKLAQPVTTSTDPLPLGGAYDPSLGDLPPRVAPVRPQRSDMNSQYELSK